MGVLVYRYIGVLVCFGNGVPVYWCTSVLVDQGISVSDGLVYPCIGVPGYRCASIPVYQCIGVHVYQCTGVPMCPCTCVQVNRCTSPPLYLCIIITMYRCTSALSRDETSLMYVCADPAWECGGSRGNQIAARWGKGCPRRAGLPKFGNPGSAILGPCGAILGPTWRHVGPCWAIAFFVRRHRSKAFGSPFRSMTSIVLTLF